MKADSVSKTRRVAYARSLCATGAGKATRLAARLSLSEIAADVGVSPSTIHRWERGERLPRADLAVRYAEVLDQIGQSA